MGSNDYYMICIVQFNDFIVTSLTRNKFLFSELHAGRIHGIRFFDDISKIAKIHLSLEEWNPKVKFLEMLHFIHFTVNARVNLIQETVANSVVPWTNKQRVVDIYQLFSSFFLTITFLVLVLHLIRRLSIDKIPAMRTQKK